jgi:ribonuclease HII
MGSFIPLEARLKKKGFFVIAGVDEAGRGPLAGPVVSAAVILKPYCKLPGLDDSKKLRSQKREELFELIVKNALDYSITAIPRQTIDKYNILNAVRFANDICVASLERTPDIVLIDGRDKQIITIPFQTIIKGDSRIRSIAAASILAKVFRDKIMQQYHKQFPNYNFSQHKGYGTRMHRDLIKKFGPCEIHRKSFKLKA